MEGHSSLRSEVATGEMVPNTGIVPPIVISHFVRNDKVHCAKYPSLPLII